MKSCWKRNHTKEWTRYSAQLHIETKTICKEQKPTNFIRNEVSNSILLPLLWQLSWLTNYFAMTTAFASRIRCTMTVSKQIKERWKNLFPYIKTVLIASCSAPTVFLEFSWAKLPTPYHRQEGIKNIRIRFTIYLTKEGEWYSYQ